MTNTGHINFTSQLLAWYKKNDYSFPWRSQTDPYSIWVSEIMLQQTRVSTVIPYYKAWMKTFPDVTSVARSEIEIILKFWEGLGYYNRAKNFYKACKIIKTDLGGKIPTNSSDFSKLPGVGPYITAAVMSIAYGKCFAAIDGNAIRVISRTNEIDIPYPKSKKEINNISNDLIDPLHPGLFNQAMMDLGREVCTPKNWKCTACPVKKYCCAYVNNSVHKYPIKTKNAPTPTYRVAVGIIWKNKKLLISKRPEDRMLGGMWEFPGGKIQNNEDPKSCIIRETREELGVLVRPKTFIKTIKHSYSHFSVLIDAYHCDYISGTPKKMGCSDWRWICPDELYDLPFPRASHLFFNDVIIRK